METPRSVSLAHLRHELRTPVNHILGFAEILIEDAEESRIEGILPMFHEIRSGGHLVLESLQSSLAGTAACVQEVDIETLAGNLRAESARVLEACTSLRENLEDGRRQTVADLDAISVALRSLMEFGAGLSGDLMRQPFAPVCLKTPSCQPDPQARPGGRILIADD